MDSEIEKILNKLENLTPESNTAEDASDVVKDLKSERDAVRERYIELLEQSLAASKSKYNLVELQAKTKSLQRNYNNKEKKLAELEMEKEYWTSKINQSKTTYDSRVQSLIDDMQSIDKMEDLSYQSRINELVEKHKLSKQKVKIRYEGIIRDLQTRLEKEKEKSGRLERELSSYKFVREPSGYSKSQVQDKEAMIRPVNTSNKPGTDQEKVQVKEEPIDDGYESARYGSPLVQSKMTNYLRITPQKRPVPTELKTNNYSPVAQKSSLAKAAITPATKSLSLLSLGPSKNEQSSQHAFRSPKIPKLNLDFTQNQDDEYNILATTLKPRKSVVYNKRKGTEIPENHCEFVFSTSKNKQTRPVSQMSPIKRRLLNEDEVNAIDSNEECRFYNKKFNGKDVY